MKKKIITAYNSTQRIHNQLRSKDLFLVNEIDKNIGSIMILIDN